MNPPSMESIFLILSGVILAAGILYWFWSHIQLTQKKVQLLENAVFELRGMVTGPVPVPASGPGLASDSLPEKEPVYNDLADDDWEQEQEQEQGQGQGQEDQGQPMTVEPLGSTPLDALNEEGNNDLQPGGRADNGKEETQFRELFVQQERKTPTPMPTPTLPVTTESLEAMPVRELRRLAEQRGLTGVSDLKKKELLSALRQQLPLPSPSKGQGQSVVVERTLDLTEVPVADVKEVSEIAEVETTVLE